MRQPPPVKFNPVPRYRQVLGAATCQEDQESVKSPRPSSITRNPSIAYCYPKKQAWERHRHGPGKVNKVRSDSLRRTLNTSEGLRSVRFFSNRVSCKVNGYFIIIVSLNLLLPGTETPSHRTTRSRWTSSPIITRPAQTQSLITRLSAQRTSSAR